MFTRRIYHPFLIFIFTLFTSFFYLHAQDTDIHWSKSYGGNLSDRGEAVQLTSDDGYIISGGTQTLNPENPLSPKESIYILKTDVDGDTLWTKIFKGSGNSYAYSVRQTPDGGYILVGSTNSFSSGDYDVYLIKTDADGNELWYQTYGGDNNENGYSVQLTIDGGFVIVGETYSFGAGSYDVYLIKTDAKGDTLWTKTYGGEKSDRGNSVQQTADGGYAITGYYSKGFGSGGDDVYLIKTDANGKELWSKTYGGDDSDYGYAVEQTADGGYIIAGETYSFGAGWSDVYLIKTNAEGDTLWTKTYGGDNSDSGRSLYQTDDGGYVIAGYSYSGGSGDIYFIKTDAAGSTLLEKILGTELTEEAYGIQPATGGGYVLVGFVGQSYGNDDVYILKTNKFETAIDHKANLTPDKFSVSQNYPNPFNPQTTIKIEAPKTGIVQIIVYNVIGKRVRTLVNEVLQPGTYYYKFDGYSLSSGVYYYTVKADNFYEVKRMVLLK